MLSYLAIALGSAAGGALRSLVGFWLVGYTPAGFPVGTWVVNVSGSLLLGMLIPLLEAPGWLPAELFWLLVVGLCGSYTTVSTFSLQSVVLANGGRRLTAAVYITTTVFACLTAVAVGYAVAGLWISGPT